MNGENYFAKRPIESICYTKINQDLNRKLFFSCDSSIRSLYFDMQMRPHHDKPLSLLHDKQ